MLFSFKTWQHDRKAMWAAIYIAGAFVAGGGMLEVVCLSTLLRSHNSQSAAVPSSAETNGTDSSLAASSPPTTGEKQRPVAPMSEQLAVATSPPDAVLITPTPGLSH